MKTRIFIASLLAMSVSAYADERPSDPMLAPLTAAPEVIRSWDDALARIRHAPDLLTSLAEVEHSAGQYRIALANVLPSVVAIGSYQHAFRTESLAFGPATVTVPAPNTWSISAQATWILDARAVHGVGTADAEIALARLSLAERKRELAGATVTAILATLTSEHVASLARVSLQAALERLVLTQKRLEFAHGTELDVDRAEQDVESARAQLIQADEATREAREGLGQLVGSSSAVGPNSDLDIEGFEQAIASTCRPTTDVEHRADVAEARKGLDIAERGVTDAKLRFVPTLGVSSQAGDANVSTLGPTSTWSFAATITVPLYDGGARYGALRTARADVARARQALESTRIAAIIDAARADRAIDVATQARDVARRERDLAARVDTRVRQGYAAGLGTSLDLVTSAQTLRQDEIELATAEFQVARARAGAVLAHAECVF
jgi:outer membrane protein TolC